jgi:hypothetical protein
VTNIPQECFLTDLSSDELRRPDFNVNNVQAPGHVRTFLNNLHRVVANAGVDIGTAESRTGTLINHILLRVINFGDWLFSVRLAIIENAFACYIFKFLMFASYLT